MRISSAIAVTVGLTLATSYNITNTQLISPKFCSHVGVGLVYTAIRTFVNLPVLYGTGLFYSFTRIPT